MEKKHIPTVLANRFSIQDRAHALREHFGSLKAALTAVRLHDQRQKAKSGPAPALSQRLLTHLADRYAREIARRHWPTTIPDKHSTAKIHVRERCHGVALLCADGWRYYSHRTPSRYQSLRYLCGRDNGQTWAVRVPGTVRSLDEALAWIKPAAVKKAEAAGRRVLRQGEFYLVEGARDSMNALRGTDHKWDSATRTISHPQHGILPVDFHARAIPQLVVRSHGGRAD